MSTSNLSSTILIKTGTIHAIPENLQHVLNSDETLRIIWNQLTDLARNEWICWITIAKKIETRDTRLSRLVEEIKEGQKRPCCWPGCPHHRPNAQKWFEKKKD